MKRLIFSWMLFLLACCLPVCAKNKPVDYKLADQQVFKIHLTPILLNNYGVQYERMIGSYTSFTLNARWMPRGQIPMIKSFEPFVGDLFSMVDTDKISIGGYSLWPEVRFYFNRAEGPRGFYIAPYASFSSYTARLDQYEFSFVDPDDQVQYISVDLDAMTRSFTAGLSIGAQWRIGNALYLDWWIIGASYGVGKGDLNAFSSQVLQPEWQEAVRSEIESLEIRHLEVRAEVGEQGAHAKLSGPWASVKAGLSLGFKF